jgi:hypothetical protein
MTVKAFLGGAIKIFLDFRVLRQQWGSQIADHEAEGVAELNLLYIQPLRRNEKFIHMRGSSGSLP